MARCSTSNADRKAEVGFDGGARGPDDDGDRQRAFGAAERPHIIQAVELAGVVGSGKLSEPMSLKWRLYETAVEREELARMAASSRGALRQGEVEIVLPADGQWRRESASSAKLPSRSSISYTCGRPSPRLKAARPVSDSLKLPSLDWSTKP